MGEEEEEDKKEGRGERKTLPATPETATSTSPRPPGPFM